MGHEKVTEGINGLGKGLTATQSMISAFGALIPHLPKNWKTQMYTKLPHLNTASGATRLTKIRQGVVAPTLRELEEACQIAGQDLDTLVNELIKSNS